MSELFEGSESKSLTDIKLAAIHSKLIHQCTELTGQPSDGKPLTRNASERATTPLAFSQSTADAHSPRNTRTTDKAESDGPQQTDVSVSRERLLRHIESSEAIRMHAEPPVHF